MMTADRPRMKLARRGVLTAAVLFATCCVLSAVTRTLAQAPPADAPPATDPAEVAEPAPAEQPEPEPRLIVRDLLVLQLDRYGETANDPRAVQTTLFNGVYIRDRQVSFDGGAVPLGIITVQGGIGQPIMAQMDVMSEGAMFHAHWPLEQKGLQRINWYQVHEAEPSTRPDPRLPEDHWLAPLRDAEDRLWLTMRETTLRERFMLYDVSLPYASPVQVAAAQPGNGAYDLICDNAQLAPLLTLLVEGDASAGWSAQQAAFNPATGDLAVRELRPDGPPSRDLRVALAPLAELLTERGYNQTEVRLAMDMARSAGLDTSRLALVYVMPEGRIDQLVPLRFRPEPDRVVRTAIVVVTNVDPNLGSRVESLIAELGSDDWPTRERAQKELVAMGQAAIRQVQAQRAHPDPETAFRLRQVLDAYDLRFGSPDP